MFFHNLNNVFQCIVLKCPLNPSEKSKIERSVRKHTRFDGHCFIWTGQMSRDGYGQIRFMFRAKRIKVAVHRLVFFLHESRYLSPEMHVSHICHVKNCITYTHLSYESQRINNNRMKCRNDGYCHGHFAYPSCFCEVRSS
jgi:hypothetical protein